MPAGIASTQWSYKSEICAIDLFRFYRAELSEYSPQNCQNFEFCPHICHSWATRMHIFLQNSWRFVHVYRQLLSFQFRCFRGTNNQVKSNFPHVMGAFSPQIFNSP